MNAVNQPSQISLDFESDVERSEGAGAEKPEPHESHKKAEPGIGWICKTEKYTMEFPGTMGSQGHMQKQNREGTIHQADGKTPLKLLSVWTDQEPHESSSTAC